MLLGVIVFSLLFIVFVVFGTLLISGKGYVFISGYRNLNNKEKTEFVAKNNLKKIFSFYSYYCFGVAGVTLLALIGACCNSMVVIFVSYLLFGAGTIATLIIVNANSNYKIVPVNKENKIISKNSAQIKPELMEATEVTLKVEKEESSNDLEPNVEEKEENVVENKTQNKKSTTGTKKTPSKTTKTNSSAKKSTTKSNSNKTTKTSK